MVTRIVDSYHLGNRFRIPFEKSTALQMAAGESTNTLPAPTGVEDESVDVISNLAGQSPCSVSLPVELAGPVRSIPGDEQFRDQPVEQPLIRERQ